MYKKILTGIVALAIASTYFLKDKGQIIDVNLVGKVIGGKLTSDYYALPITSDSTIVLYKKYKEDISKGDKLTISSTPIDSIFYGNDKLPVYKLKKINL